MMTKSCFPIEKFKSVKTPFYYYDTNILQATLDTIKQRLSDYPDSIVHYAVKANANPKILKIISKAGFGADCVSGPEIEMAIACGFHADKIVFAGVGKSDEEIELGLDKKIFCFNVESEAELDVINQIATEKNMTAHIAFRINPNVGAHTHAYITTGLDENKFGINMELMEHVIAKAQNMNHIAIEGLHFHIGSQILMMDDFAALSKRINELQDKFNIKLKHINVGGGLGIDYDKPDANPIPGFTDYFDTFHKNLKLRDGQTLHFELGRSIVGQCGSLISKVIYVKQGSVKKFAILDAGFTDLIRPALYQAHHKIENLTSDGEEEAYDVVGPICESTDVFAKGEKLNKVKRGDYIALRSAGAYGEIMAMGYNCRPLPKGYLDTEF